MHIQKYSKHNASSKMLRQIFSHIKGQMSVLLKVSIFKMGAGALYLNSTMYKMFYWQGISSISHH